MLEQFCSFLQGQGKSENTVKSYRLAVDGYMKWYRATFGGPVRQLYRANVLDYISYLRTVKRLANRSVDAKLAALQSFNEYLVDAGIQTDSVLSKRDYLKVQTAYANPSTVNREQVESFRQRVLVGNGSRDYAIVTILAYAGLRISECLALTQGGLHRGQGGQCCQGVSEEPAGYQQPLPVPQPQGRCPDPRAGQSDLQQLF